MSKRIKIIISALVVVLLLTMGATMTVMANDGEPEEELLPPGVEAEVRGLVARVAEILGIDQEDLVAAFNQARQEMRVEAFDRFLDKAVEQGRIASEEAGEIREWWEQRPEALGPNVFPRACIRRAIRGRQMIAASRGWCRQMSPMPVD